MKIAVYPGTFDPITNGHVKLVTRASSLFDRVIVAVASNARKAPELSFKTRLSLAREVFQNTARVQVAALEGLLVDFVKQHKATLIVRGLRAAIDFEHEFQLASINHQLAPEIETVFLPALDESAAISSTMIREIHGLGGDVSRFVPAAVMAYLQGE